MSPGSEWSNADWLTLQLGPVWIVSALTGRCRFDEHEQAAFWRAVEDAPDTSALSWQLVRAMVQNREWLLDEFSLDDRSIASGLGQVATLLDRLPTELSRETREAMLRVGYGFARARGPFGQSIIEQDLQCLQLVAQLLQSSVETARNNPLNAASAC